MNNNYDIYNKVIIRTIIIKDKFKLDYILIVGPKFSGIIVLSSNILPSNRDDLYLWVNRLLLDQ